MKRAHIFHLLTSYALLLLCISCSGSGKKSSEKKVFRYNQAGGLTSLDPAFASSQANIWATTQLFNGLVVLDSNLHVQPSIAKYWEVDTTQIVYTFYLRNDVFFHDSPLFAEGKGRRVVASDFEYSFRRIVDTNDIYNRGMWIFNGNVLQKQDGSISDTCFKAVNDSVFRIYLQKPIPNFLEILSMPYAYVVPKEVTEYYQKDFRNHPIGTGPFKFFLWEEGNSLVLHKNSHYWKVENDVRLPKIDAVQVSFVPDKSQAYREFLIGELDFFSGVEQSSVDEILNKDGSVNQEMSKRFSIKKCDYLNTEYLGFQMDSTSKCYKNGENGVLLDVNFRKALSFAIDKVKLVRFVKNNLGTPGQYGFVPRATPNFNQTKINGYKYNKDSATAYLNMVDKDKILAFDVHITKEHKPLTEFIVKQWQEVLGVTCNIKIHDAGVLRQMANNGDAACFRASWLGDYPDAENYLSVFYGDNFTPNGPNKTHFKNEQFDSLFREAYGILDVGKRSEINERMDQLIMNDCPALILYYDEVLILTAKDISGLSINGMNSLRLESVNKFVID